MRIASNRLKTKFFLFFGLSVAALFTLIAVSMVMQLREAVTVATRIAVEPVLRRAAALIDGDEYERLAQTLDPADPFYIQTQEKFRDLKKKSQTLYIYTMARYEGDVHRFIFDAEDPNSEKFSPLGTEEDVSDYEKAYLLTYETKTTQYSSINRVGAWGPLISAFKPILNSKGKLVGIVGVDFEADAYYQTTMLIVVHQVAFALLYIVIGLSFYFFFLKDLARQNEELYNMFMRAETASLLRNAFLSRIGAVDRLKENCKETAGDAP